MTLSVSEHLIADTLAGHYVDGDLSYIQILNMCMEKYGISKETLDEHIVLWRKALGEEALLKYDIQKGVEVS